MSDKLFKSVLPAKIYAVHDDCREIDELIADDAKSAFEAGRIKWGKRCRAVYLTSKTGKPNTREVMFE